MLAICAGRRDEGPVIHVRYPHPRPCHAARCEIPAVACVVWVYGENVSAYEVCKGHMEAMKAHDQPCVFAPLDSLPPLPTLAAQIRLAYAQAQMRAAAQNIRRQRPMWMHTTMQHGFNTSTTSNIYFTNG